MKLIKKLITKIIGRKLLRSIKPDARTFLAKKYIRGYGIEIGALQSPLIVPSYAHVKYVDILSVKESRLRHPELKKHLFVNVDIIDNGETLEKIYSESQDFVIANHFLEHCENPIGTIESFLRVLKKGGILYLAIPDKRFTFDLTRPVTDIEHLLKDYTEGPECSRAEHAKEWQSFIDKKFKNDPGRPIEILINDKYSSHVHVWTYLELLELVVCLNRKLGFHFEVKEFTCTGNECIFILKKF